MTHANQSPAQTNKTALAGQASSNVPVMDFMRQQAVSGDDSEFQDGRFFGACEALCMAGVITAAQWQELDDLKNAKD